MAQLLEMNNVMMVTEQTMILVQTCASQDAEMEFCKLVNCVMMEIKQEETDVHKFVLQKVDIHAQTLDSHAKEDVEMEYNRLMSNVMMEIRYLEMGAVLLALQSLNGNVLLFQDNSQCVLILELQQWSQCLE